MSNIITEYPVLAISILSTAAVVGIFIRSTHKTTEIKKTGKLKFLAKADYFQSHSSYNPITKTSSTREVPYTDFEYSLEGVTDSIVVSIPIDDLTPVKHKELESINQNIQYIDNYRSSILQKRPTYSGSYIDFFEKYDQGAYVYNEKAPQYLKIKD